ncbi:phospholipase D-like domain-containing protein [Paraburkholderia sp. BL10I2N1]|uniref:phospholipase D-like domain-containing protein n=1 Tax=Paraburkholderia sp. BL10I2N1 TaxID=1938796 RepID=UPI0010F15D70|nr:phospholipase D-like domain-containing protein [Paraburkholderia sp. BL10I2N1]TDN67032.1 phospholipase D-like protein [Paraburkholderia sp. BL10I2N1]
MSTFIWNQSKTGEHGHLAAIRKGLVDAHIISMCSGHLKFGGIKAIADELKKAVDRGARVIFYSNDKHTEQDAADGLATLGVEHIVVDHSRSYLHTKLYYFEAGDRYSAIVGSANITKAALTSNEELSYVVGGIKGDPQHRQLAAYLAHLDRRCRRDQALRIGKNGSPIPLVYR